MPYPAMPSVLKRKKPQVAQYLFSNIEQAALEKELLNVLKNSSLSIASQTQFAKKLSQWVQYIPQKTLDKLLSDPDSAMKELLNNRNIKHSHANHHIYISAVVGYLTHKFPTHPQLDAWKSIQKDNSMPLMEHYLDNKPTELQKDKQISYSELLNAIGQLPYASQERLLLSFYTLIEPIRADYYSTQIFMSEPNNLYKKDYMDQLNNDQLNQFNEVNYIIIDPESDSATIHINDFKTKKRHSPIENDIPTELVKELKASLSSRPRSYLFIQCDGQSPYTRKLFSNWACRTLTSILKRPMTLTAIRHAYISHFMSKCNSKEELIKIAQKMGHSRSMQQAYKWNM